MEQQLGLTYEVTQLWPVNQRRSIARKQQRDYNGKPWAVGLPTHDILGNALCFNDEPCNLASRYWVVGATETGAHIRKKVCGNFSAHGATEAEALAVGTEWADRIRMDRECVPVHTHHKDGVFIVEFRGFKRSLD